MLDKEVIHMEGLINTEKIISVKKAKKCTTKELAKLSGVPKGTLDKILSGQTKDPKIQTLVSICAVLECSVCDILNMENDGVSKNNIISKEEIAFLNKYNSLDKHGKEAVNAVMRAEENRIEESRTVIYYDTRMINHYIIGASAGTGMLLTSSDYDVVCAKGAPKNADFTVSVSGDSMYPLFCDGDVLFVEKTGKISENEIGIFVKNGESFVKRLGKGALISENPKYAPIKFVAGDEINVCGRVIGKGKIHENGIIVFEKQTF